MTKYKTHSFGHIMKKCLVESSTSPNIALLVITGIFCIKQQGSHFPRVSDKVQQKAPLFCIFIGFCRVEGTKKGALLLLASSIHYHF